MYAVSVAARGATVGCDSYRVDDWELIDTPGLLRSSDVETTRLALERLRGDLQLQTVPVEKYPDLMRRVAALRVKDYLLKPARPSEIKRRVTAYLS